MFVAQKYGINRLLIISYQNQRIHLKYKIKGNFFLNCFKEIIFFEKSLIQ
jgi:hypothetical protein